MSRPREGGIEVMGRVGRYNDEISHTRLRARIPRPDPTVPRCTAQSPQVAFRPQQVAKVARAPTRARLRRPEGGPRKARMKTRVITLLLVAGVLAVAASHRAQHPGSRADPDGLRAARRRLGRAGDGGRAARLVAERHPAARHAGSRTRPTRRRRRRPPRAFRSRRRRPTSRRRRRRTTTGRAPTAARRRSNTNSGREVKQNSDGTRELVGEVEGSS